VGSRLSLLALGLGAYLTFVVVSFPASAAYRWFAPSALQLAAIEGSVWNGSAAYGSYAGLAFSELRWQLHPAALLTGRLNLSAEGRFMDGFAVADVSASGSRVLLTNVRASTSLQNLRGLLPLGETQGQVSLQLQSLEIVDGWPMTAIGEFSVGDLSVVPFMPADGQRLMSLGSYQARFTEQEAPGIVGVVNDRGGPLELSGRISLAPDRSYRIEALLMPRAGAPADLVQGVNFMTGPPNAQGQRSFEMTGSL
jgi:general secretion pathway protein N